MAYIKQILALLFILAGLFGFYFFKNYEGESIPFPKLWFAVSLVAGFSGFLLIFLSGKKEDKKLIDQFTKELNEFKSKAEKVELNYDWCEFKSTGFVHEVEDKNYSWMAGRVAFSHEITKTETVHQSGLIYHNKKGNGEEKFYSHSFRFDKTALQFYVMNKKINLYVDRFNRKKYIFDVEE